MKALVYHGVRDVRVEEVPDPRLEAPDDAIVRVTSTAICGSDLHLYHGTVPGMKPGDILGHEFMGVVEEVGADVRKVKPGDRVVVPFVISCGDCFFCRLQLWTACENTNPGPGPTLLRKGIRPAAALYGYSHLYGGIPGGQAEYARVLRADINAFKVPDGLDDDQVLFLTDILPTGWQAAINAEVGPGTGTRIAIVGAGPVGLMTAMCARFLGAERIYIVDDAGYRLDFARDMYGAVPIDFTSEDPAERIVDETDGHGVDGAIDAVGFEAKGSRLENVLTTIKLEGGSGAALRECIAAVRRGGVVSIPGVYAGFLHGFMLGDCFDKGVTLRMGQTHVHRFVPYLLDLIASGKLLPHQIISHRVPLADAARAYAKFDRHEDGCRKVVLKPGAQREESSSQ